ncbi:MAG: cyclic nucleotide-binding domain-containing protein, partial [Pseudomonadota bacterium]
LELVFAALDALHEEIPFRRLYLASQSFDARQRALAAETLDEFLPRAYKRKVLQLLEPGKPRSGAKTPKPWTDWQRQLEDPDQPTGPRLKALLSCGLFPGWRFVDLKTLADATCDSDTVALTLRDGEAIDIEQVILRGQNLTEHDGDIRISLQAVYAVIAENPRCGGLWLRGLAQRVPEQAGAGGEITRSEFMSLATRTLSEDQATASDMEIWQRVFFLRTMAMTQTLPAGRLRLLAEIARTLSAETGDVIINEGRLGNHFYMVCSGKLEVSAKDNAVTHLGPSDAFGAMSLMLGARRSFTVRAAEKSELLTIDRVDFLDLIDAHPSLVRSFSRTMAQRIYAARKTHGTNSGEQPA